MARIPPDYDRSLLLPELGGQLAAAAGWSAHVVRGLAFWTAVVLPFLYLPLLVGGLPGQEGLALGGLLVVNIVALVAGHDYARGATS